MIFINLLANIAPSNSNRQPYIDALTKLIVMEDPESPNTTYYSGNLSEAIKNTEGNSPLVESLNPTLFKDEDSTFPLIDAIHIRNSAINLNSILRSSHPNTSFWVQYLKGNVTRLGDQHPRLLASVLCLNQNFRNITGYNRREPNLYFSKIYEAFKCTRGLNEKISINNEAHASLLNDQKNLCVVNRFKPRTLQTDSNQCTVKDQHQVFQYLRDFILITLALKE